MALVELGSLPAPYALESDEGPQMPDWYRNIDNWSFDDGTLLSRSPRTPPPPQTAWTEDASTASMTFTATEELWDLLNLLERDATLVETTPSTSVERKSSATDAFSLQVGLNQIKCLENDISDLAREGPLVPEVRRQRFVTQCKRLILDLEANYSPKTQGVVLDLLERMNSLLLQFRDAIDPFNSCIVCSEAIRTSEFPKRVTSSCRHTVSTCFDCLKTWVAASLSERGFAQLKCMECSSNLNGDDIRAIASQETFQRYNDLSARTVLHSMKDFYFCLNPKCSSGQIHYGGAKLECHACKNQICAKHSVAWHEGETCTQYDTRRTDAQKEYDASEELKVVLTRACPTCDAPIEKNGGCSHMNCWKCDAHFNWEDAPTYFAKAFVWERDRNKLSEAIHDTRKKSLPWRLLARLFSSRRPSRATITPVDVLDVVEDGC